LREGLLFAAERIEDDENFSCERDQDELWRLAFGAQISSEVAEPGLSITVAYFDGF
jgi:hypothetical protein